jgi:hypothetical protein
MSARTAAVVAVFLAVAPAGAATVPSGLRGIVERGPIAPVCRVDEPCTEPARHVTLVFGRAGRAVRRSTTDAAGRYRVRLSPGVYRVRLSVSPGIGRGISPEQVRVRASRYARVDFSIDTGIR